MVFNNSILLGAAGQGGAAPFDSTLIGNSIWLEGAETSGDAMTRIWGAESNQDRWIWATWYQPLRVIDAVSKRNNLFASGSASHGFYLNHTSTSSTFNIFHRDNAGSEGAINTTESYRDTTSWIHVLVDYDSANANAENRISLYVNGVRTGVNSGNRPGQNNNINVNVQNQTARIGQDLSTTPNYHVQGYLAQTIFLDNKSIANGDLAITDFLDTFTFGTNGSQIVPKKDSDIIALASAAGANSFCLDYSDASSAANLVSDASSKGNNFSTSTIATANQSTSTPSKTFATYNALFAPQNHTVPTFSNGNTIATNTNSAWSPVSSSFGVSSGKWYFETKIGSVGNGVYVGVVRDNINVSGGTGKKAYRSLNGQKYDVDNSNASYGDSFTTGDIIGTAVDLEGGGLWFSKNGTWQNSATISEIEAGTTTNAAFTDLVSTLPSQGWFFGGQNAGSPTASTEVNFGFGTYSISSGNTDSNGHGNFEYPPPANFLSLCTANLTAPDFQGIDYFDATLYEGNGMGQRVGDFVPVTDVGTITKSFLSDGRTNSGTTDLTIAHGVSTSPTNVQVKTLSFWIKPVDVDQQYIYSGSVGASDSTDSSERIYIASNGEVAYQTRQSGSAVAYALTAGNFINDPAQWFNVVVALNYDSSTAAADTLKIYVNGVEQTLDGGTTDSSATLPLPGMTAQAYINKASTRQLIGTHPGFTSASSRSNCYLAEMYMVDGQALDASAFGVLDTSTNRWVPKAPATIKSTITGTGAGFGSCGFYLDFLDASDLGDDDSGNTRDFTESATIGTANQSNDSPSVNFAVMNPGDQDSSTATTLSEGNLKVSMSTTAGDGIRGTLPYNGKMYWEVELDSVSTNSGSDIGIATKNHNLSLVADSSSNTNAFVGISSFDSNLRGFIHNSALDVSYGGLGSNFATAGKFLMFAVDIDAGKFWAGYDGTFFNSGNPAAGTNDSGIDLSAYDTWFPAISRIGSAGSENFIFNFGQRSFAHTPPTGFSNLNQDNLDDTSSKLTAWAWIKNRDADDSHILVDRVRGVGEVLHSDATDLEATEPNTVQRFLQRGVQVGSDVQVNTANESYVLWQWLVGEAATTTTINASSTTPTNSIASTVVAADAGHFSVVGYQGNSTNGATVAHSLGGEPELIFFRGREGSGASSFLWRVFSTVGGAGKYLRLNDTTALQDDTAYLNNTLPGSVVFTLGTDGDVNNSNYTYIAYCFRSVPGVCKVGSYTGNGDGSTGAGYSGPYISLGFKPKFILLKRTDAANSWILQDTSRHLLNPVDNYLQAESNSFETGTSGDVDFLSDAIKIRNGNGNAWNANGGNYLYLAMADLGGNGTLPPIYGR